MLVEECDSSRCAYQPGEFTAYRIVSVERAPKADKGDDIEKRLAELRKRLGELDEDDITDSTARLRLEGEIYKLTRELDSPDADEWAEVIGGDG